MGPNQTYQLLHSKGNYKQNENTPYRTGGNIGKSYLISKQQKKKKEPD